MLPMECSAIISEEDEREKNIVMMTDLDLWTLDF